MQSAFPPTSRMRRGLVDPARLSAQLLRWLILATPLAVAAGGSWIIEGRVVGVSDGDTITVLDDAKTQHKIRLAGIDAPEKGRAFGERSRQSLSALVLEKRVEARCHKKDRYAREVCAVFVSLREVGLEQIRTGMVWSRVSARVSYARAPRISRRGRRSEGRAARAVEGSKGDTALGVAKGAIGRSSSRGPRSGQQPLYHHVAGSTRSTALWRVSVLGG